MGNSVSKLCKDCNNCIPFLLSSKKSVNYIELAELPQIKCESPKEITEESPNIHPISRSSLNPSEFLLHSSAPLDLNSEKILEKDDFQIYGQLNPESFTLKALWHSKFSPTQILNLFRNTETRKSWDKNIEKIEEIPSALPEEFFTYMKFKKVFAISQRDSLIISNIFQMPDGILIASKSTILDSHPVNQDVTRMKILLAGFYLKGINEGENKTQVFNLTIADFGGVVSHKLVQKATALALPKMYQLMEKCMDEFYQKLT